MTEDNQDQNKLEDLLLKGVVSLENGKGIEATPELWDGIKKRFRERRGRDLGAPKTVSGT